MMFSPNYTHTRAALKHKQQGLSLVEVLVALVVVAVALGAALQTVGTAASTETRLREQLFARWVASNQLANLRIEGQFPRVGSTTGQSEMASVKWDWKQTTTATPSENIRQVEVIVWLEGLRDKGDPSSSMSVFVSKIP